MKRVLTCLCALLLLCGGCTPVQQESPVLAHPAQQHAAPAAPAASAAPAPQPMDEAALEEDLRALWAETPALDIAPLLPANFFDAEAPWQLFGTTAEERAWLPAMEAPLQAQLSAAAARVTDRFAASHPALTVTSAQTVEAPSWQLVYALLQGCKSSAEANERLTQALSLSVTVGLSTPDMLVYRVNVRPLFYREALRLSPGEESAYWSRCFTYSYLYTVLDQDATEIAYELPPASGCLSDGVLWPLQSHIRLRKTWYAPRDGGKRKHTGTDIWADAETEIYSCTDGVVSYVGESAGTGFAVIVTSEDGYQFHYYHMMQLYNSKRANDLTLIAVRNRSNINKRLHAHILSA